MAASFAAAPDTSGAWVQELPGRSAATDEEIPILKISLRDIREQPNSAVVTSPCTSQHRNAHTHVRKRQNYAQTIRRVAQGSASRSKYTQLDLAVAPDYA